LRADVFSREVDARTAIAKIPLVFEEGGIRFSVVETEAEELSGAHSSKIR